MATRIENTGRLVLGALLPLLTLVGCSHDADPSGAFTMQLRTSVNGVAYRLRNAVFTVTRPDIGLVVATVKTEDNPDAASATVTLAAGGYAVNLAAGWRLEKQIGAGFQTVSAQLVSQNPVSFAITAGQPTGVAYGFQTDGTIVVIGDGTLNLTINVTDISTPMCVAAGGPCVAGGPGCCPGLTCSGDAAGGTDGVCVGAPAAIVTQLAAGLSHTCALTSAGTVRCWGTGSSGQLGYGNTNTIGDDELPASAGDVNVGGNVIQITAGDTHTCALLSGGAVRCWGRGQFGRLGYGNTNNIGDDETPASAGNVNVGGAAIQISANGTHTCALMANGAVHCWGDGSVGQLGYGNNNDVGDDETPASVGEVFVGGGVVQISAGVFHTCARLATGAVRCWGEGVEGALGYGNINNIGDNEFPAQAGDVPLPAAMAQIAAGGFHTCALGVTGGVRCWGSSDFGQLGFGNTNAIGDDETVGPGTVQVGGAGGGFQVLDLALGDFHTCVRTSAGNVRCWGRNQVGQLGYGNTNNIGDDETPATAGDVNVGGSVIQVAAGGDHTCALLNNGAVRCWGVGSLGRLGYGNTNNIGDDETPASAGDVPVLSAPATFSLTINVAGPGSVNASSGLVCTAPPDPTTSCSATFPAGQMVTLTAAPAGAATFSGWGGDCASAAAGTATVTMTQARTCTATFVAAGPPPGQAPTFLAAGPAVDGTGDLVVQYPPGLAPGQLVILQFGSRSSNVPATPAGWTQLFADEHGNARQRLYYRFTTAADPSGLPLTVAAGASNVNVARMYLFSSVHTTGGPFFEGAATTSDDDGTLPGPTVTTNGLRRLGAAFVALDNNPPMEPFVGELGGDWTEAVPEFGSGTGSNFSLQLQLAPLPVAGTISGGQANFGGNSDSSICRAFALIGT